MKTLTLQLPDALELDAAELKMMLAARLYEQGKITSGQGAEMVGVSKRTFLESLGSYGVSIFNYPPEDIARDAANA